MDYCTACKRHLNNAVSCPGCGARDRELDERLARRRRPDAETTLTLRLQNLSRLSGPARTSTPSLYDRGTRDEGASEPRTQEHDRRRGSKKPGALLASAIAIPVIALAGGILAMATDGHGSGQSPTALSALSASSQTTGGPTPTAAEIVTLPQPPSGSQSTTGAPSSTATPTASTKPPTHSPTPHPTPTTGKSTTSQPPTGSPSPTCTQFLFWCS